MVRQYVKNICAAASALALLGSLGACGTSDARGANATIPGYDVSHIAADPEVMAKVPKEISEDGVLTVGSETTYAPVEFVAQDGKTAVGFEIDIAKAIAKVMGLREQTIYTPFDSAIPGIGYKYDVGISGFTITPDRMEVVDFITDYAGGSRFVTQQGNPRKVDINHLCGTTVAVQTGTMQEEDLLDAKQQCKVKQDKPLHVQSMSLQTDVTTAVTTGKADAFYSDATVGGYAVQQTGKALQELGSQIGVIPQAIAVKKGDTAAAKAMQAALNKLIDDGTYMKILKYWGVESGAIERAEINPEVNDD